MLMANEKDALIALDNDVIIGEIADKSKMLKKWRLDGVPSRLFSSIIY